MAIFHLHVKVISRSKGKSITAAAAYRSGQRIEDNRTGIISDYSRKKGVYSSEILLPETAPSWMGDRCLLWNAVERVEKRKDAQLAREIDVALPIELNHKEKRELLRGFVQRELVSQGMVADLAFHDFDSHNPHAHILLTTRRIEGDGFGKKERSWNNRHFLVKLRQSWQDHANLALKIAGREEQIDCRTLAAQGSRYIPQIHLGPAVAALMGRNLATERGDTYLAIQLANEEIDALEGQITALEKTFPIQEHPTPVEDQRAKIWQATATIIKLLQHFGQETQAGWEFPGERLYNYQASPDFQRVELYAQDGRGLLLKQQDGEIRERLTSQDLDNLQKLEDRLQPEIERRAREVVQISLSALPIAQQHFPEKIQHRDGWTKFEGHRYTYHASTHTDPPTLEIQARDGRGTILKQQGEQIESQLTADDFRRFKQLQTKIDEILNQKDIEPIDQATKSRDLEY